MVNELEARAEEDDFINGVNRAAIRRGKEFVFFQVCWWSGGHRVLHDKTMRVLGSNTLSADSKGYKVGPAGSHEHTLEPVTPNLAT